MTEQDLKKTSVETLLNSSVENPIRTVLKGEAVTIDDLFAMEPEDLSDHEVDLLIHHLRERRVEWEMEEASSKAGGRKQTARAAGAPKKKTGKVKLDSILSDDLLDGLLDEAPEEPSNA